jgi:elongation factor G
MGELHLEVLVNRLLNEFKVQLRVGQPRVAYRQTLSKRVEVEGRHVKQTGGHGQFAVAKMVFEPHVSEDERDVVFENKIVGGAIPGEYIPSVEKGVRAACIQGHTLRFPFVNVKAQLVDGKFHEVDSSDIAFQLAGGLAFRQAIEKTAVVLLEPRMRLEVVVPGDNLGEVVGDLNGRRAEVREVEPDGDFRIIRAIVPLAEMFSYTTRLRSLTQGRGTSSMEPFEYSPVPAHVAEKVRKERLEFLEASRRRSK